MKMIIHYEVFIKQAKNGLKMQSGCQGLSWTNMENHGISWTIMTIMDCNGLTYRQTLVLV